MLMLKRILFLLIVCASVAHAADNSSPGAANNPPSEASIKQLLEAAQARKLIDSVMAQMDTVMKQTMQQATQGQQVPPTFRKISISERRK